MSTGSSSGLGKRRFSAAKCVCECSPSASNCRNHGARHHGRTDDTPRFMPDTAGRTFAGPPWPCPARSYPQSISAEYRGDRSPDVGVCARVPARNSTIGAGKIVPVWVSRSPSDPQNVECEYAMAQRLMPSSDRTPPTPPTLGRPEVAAVEKPRDIASTQRARKGQTPRWGGPSRERRVGDGARKHTVCAATLWFMTRNTETTQSSRVALVTD